MVRIITDKFAVDVNTNTLATDRGFGCMKCDKVVVVVPKYIEPIRVRGLVLNELDRHIDQNHGGGDGDVFTLIHEGKVKMRGVYLETGTIN